MAGDWLKIEANTPDKPEVIGIADILGIPPTQAFGCLFMVWRWFDQHTTEGNAKNVTTALVDRLTGVPGFADAMRKVEWIVETECGLKLPNFDAHNSNSAKSRAETAVRVAKHKAKKRTVADAHVDDSGDRDAIPRPVKRAVMDRDGSTCVYCGRKDGEYVPPETARDATMHIDHVIPVTRGGTNDITNLVCACSVCNRFKTDRTPDECGLDWPKDKDGERFGNASAVTNALPREREEKRREELKPSVLASSVPSSPTSTTAGRVCARLKQAGVSAVNPSNPKLLALLDAGLGEDELADIAGEPGAKGKGFAWILAAAEGRRREAATIGNLPNARASPYRTRMDQQAETLAGLTGGLVSPKPKESNNDRSIEPEYRALPSAAVG